MRRLLILLFVLLASPVLAQDRATLVADSLAIVNDQVLIAEGHVEIFYRGQRLVASRLTYDQAGDRLTIQGPIRLEDGTGTFILASSAELTADLTEGILISARLVLNNQLQLAAAEISRSAGGRYTRLSQVVASSCTICAGDPTPLWEIRAKTVTHDRDAQQIYFDNAQLRFYGVPVFYIPRLRLPDPTLTRATGFLQPRLRSTSALGTGLKLPYFVTLGRSADLLLTPYLTTEQGRTLNLRFRQAFRFGQISVTGAATQDRLLPDQTRGYLAFEGAFQMPADFTLDFHGIAVSDPAYLLDYGISDADRLDSRIEISRTRRNEYFSARLIGFQTIREGESNQTIPALVTDLTFHRRFNTPVLGGEGGFQFQTHSHYRTSASALDGDGDGIADGRDLGRASATADWRRNWVLPNGMTLAALGQLTADYYEIGQDDVYAGPHSRVYGLAAVELRWPWLKSGRDGISQVIEPVVQLVLAPPARSDIPNEDSTLVEFDEGNLFSLNRFPGSDAVEAGAHANIGVSYLRTDPAGWNLGIIAGQVIRAGTNTQFGDASGLSGLRSDWLLAWQLSSQSGLALTNRVLIDPSQALSKAELRLDLNRPGYGLGLGYEFIEADALEDRPDATSELVADARYDFSRAWSATLNSRYDFIAARAAQAGLGLSFRNECVDFNLSLSRRYTTSTSVKPATDFSLSVDLLGFGGGTEPGPSRVCRR